MPVALDHPAAWILVVTWPALGLLALSLARRAPALARSIVQVAPWLVLTCGAWALRAALAAGSYQERAVGAYVHARLLARLSAQHQPIFVADTANLPWVLLLSLGATLVFGLDAGQRRQARAHIQHTALARRRAIALLALGCLTAALLARSFAMVATMAIASSLLAELAALTTSPRAHHLRARLVRAASDRVGDVALLAVPIVLASHGLSSTMSSAVLRLSTRGLSVITSGPATAQPTLAVALLGWGGLVFAGSRLGMPGVPAAARYADTHLMGALRATMLLTRTGLALWVALMTLPMLWLIGHGDAAAVLLATSALFVLASAARAPRGADVAEASARAMALLALSGAAMGAQQAPLTAWAFIALFVGLTLVIYRWLADDIGNPPLGAPAGLLSGFRWHDRGLVLATLHSAGLPLGAGFLTMLHVGWAASASPRGVPVVLAASGLAAVLFGFVAFRPLHRTFAGPAPDEMPENTLSAWRGALASLAVLFFTAALLLTAAPSSLLARWFEGTRNVLSDVAAPTLLAWNTAFATGVVGGRAPLVGQVWLAGLLVAAGTLGYGMSRFAASRVPPRWLDTLGALTSGRFGLDALLRRVGAPLVKALGFSARTVVEPAALEGPLVRAPGLATGLLRGTLWLFHSGDAQRTFAFALLVLVLLVAAWLR